MTRQSHRARRRAAQRRAQDLDDQLDAIYAQVPDVGCKGLCSPACTWIALLEIERDRITRRHGITLQDMQVRQVAPGTVRCHAFDFQTNRCTIYFDRPLICRLWGASEDTPCPHGCKSATGALLSTPKAFELMTELHRLSGENAWSPETLAYLLEDELIVKLISNIMRGNRDPEDKLRLADLMDQRAAEFDKLKEGTSE